MPALRRPPSNPNRALVGDELAAIRGAQRVQSALEWELSNAGERVPDIPRAVAEDDAQDLARSVREWLGVSLETQYSWESDAEAFRAWREQFESRGIFVFQMSIGRELCRGFSSWQDHAPVIVVNSAYSSSARTFTLFHELGHLVTRSDSVCTAYFASDGSSYDSAVERWCEEFAAACLMPVAAMAQFLRAAFSWDGRGAVVGTFDQAVRIANRFRVSIRAAALRAIDVGAANFRLYAAVDEQARVREVNQSGGGGGERRPSVRIREFGRRTAAVLAQAKRSERFTRYDVADYLDVPPREWPQIEFLAGIR